MDYPENFPQAVPEMPMYEATLARQQNPNMIGLAGAVVHRPSVTELLLYRKANLEKELEQINHALEVAKKQAGAMELLDSIAKSGVAR